MEDHDSIQPPPPPRSSGTRILLGLTVVGLALLAAGGAAVWYLMDRVDQGDVNDHSFLVVDLSGEVPEAPVTPGLFEEPDDAPPTITEIAAAIRHAATDERIDGLYVYVDSPQLGWAGWQELRSALDVFRAADKPSLAYVDGMLGNGGYYFASGAEKVVLSPGAAVTVTGLQVELTYYKGTFDKLGIVPEFEHIGDFKSFIEAYERTGPSESAAAAYDGLLDSLYSQLLKGIATGRKVDEAVVKDWIDHPTMTPHGALDRKMVDALAWPDAVEEHLKDIRTEGWLASLEAPVPDKKDDDDKDKGLTDVDEYIKDNRSKTADEDDAIAVVYASGDIVSGGKKQGLFGDDGQLTDGEVAAWLKEARQDDAVKAVVIRVNSRGGSGEASSAMLREVERTKAAGKHVVISMADAAASGGYMLACKGDYVVAQPGTLTGSIGVFGGKFDLSGAYEKIGFTKHAFKRGEMADLMSFTSPFTDAEREVFRGYLADFYKDFVEKVASGRNKSYDDIHAVAQGRVWTGEQALERGLVDALGGLDVATAKAAELAGISKYRILVLPRAKGFVEVLMDDLNNAKSPGIDVLAGVAPDVRSELAVLQNISENGGAAAFLPAVTDVR